MCLHVCVFLWLLTFANLLEEGKSRKTKLFGCLAPDFRSGKGRNPTSQRCTTKSLAVVGGGRGQCPWEQDYLGLRCLEVWDWLPRVIRT